MTLVSPLCGSFGKWGASQPVLLKGGVLGCFGGISEGTKGSRIKPRRQGRAGPTDICPQCGQFERLRDGVNRRGENQSRGQSGEWPPYHGKNHGVTSLGKENL